MRRRRRGLSAERLWLTLWYASGSLAWASLATEAEWRMRYPLPWDEPVSDWLKKRLDVAPYA